MAWAGYDAVQAPHTLEKQIDHRRERHEKELMALLSTALQQVKQSSKANDSLA
jgi:hypothetical protein